VSTIESLSGLKVRKINAIPATQGQKKVTRNNKLWGSHRGKETSIRFRNISPCRGLPVNVYGQGVVTEIAQLTRSFAAKRVRKRSHPGGEKCPCLNRPNMKPTVACRVHIPLSALHPRDMAHPVFVLRNYQFDYEKREFDSRNDQLALLWLVQVPV